MSGMAGYSASGNSRRRNGRPSGTVTKVFNAKLDVCRTTESATNAGERPSDTARSV